MKCKRFNQSGLSIIATVLVLLSLALFAAVAVSIVTTGTGTGIQEERGIEAFYIADGGLQYSLKRNTYPYYAVSSSVTLGNGSFTVSVPTTSGITSGETGTLNVSSTDGFVMSKNLPSDSTANRYWVVMCAVALPTDIRVSSDCEKISSENKTFSSFTTLTRGRDSTDAAAHPSTAVVMMYTWDDTKTTTLSDKFQTSAKCKGASKKICVSNNSSFATSGFIRIYNATENNTEDVFYDGKGNDASVCGGCAQCLGTNGCSRRAFDGGIGTVEHASGATIYQSEFSALATSKGVISGAILSGNIQRVIQGNILPLQDP